MLDVIYCPYQAKEEAKIVRFRWLNRTVFGFFLPKFAENVVENAFVTKM